MPMIKKKIKNEKGVTLVALALSVAVLIILSNVIIYNVRDNLEVGKLTKMKNDIQNLRDKVSSYYAQNGTIPAHLVYPNIDPLKTAGVISQATDTGKFLVIDLSAIENLTLNNGADFENVKSNTSLTEEEAKSNTDLYVINENSHNIFYVEGVTIDNETYYTDIEEVDTVPVDLRYIEGVKIPEGFHYAGGTKALGNIFIKNSDETETYRWIVVEKEITEIPANMEINDNEKEDFIKSVNSYGGYYKNENNNTVKYFTLEKWSPKFDEEGIYQDKNGDTAYIPKDFQVSEVPGENTIDGGLIVKDNNQNEWVWIEVPKSIYTQEAYNGGRAPENSEDYTKIESVMQAYASDYRANGYTDNFYSTEQDGFADETAYQNWKNSMLKSVYEKGGFYIGRYEVGTDTQRTSVEDTLTTPFIQRDKYPYNYVTCTEAQKLAKQLSTGEKQGSLMFGIQWDLVMKFIEVKGVKTQTQLKTDSAGWGNYYDADFMLNRGKHSIFNSDTYVLGGWNLVNNTRKTNNSKVLLTTGITDRNSTLGICDLAGNVGEWTLEKSANTVNPCVYRGGDYIERWS